MSAWGFPNQMVGSGTCIESVARMNGEIEHDVAASLTNENLIEEWWSHACRFTSDRPEYWLLLARLAEAALLCAGNYADNGEYESAGDFLVNPREILIHRRADGSFATKVRHGGLSDQFGLNGPARFRKMKQFSAGVSMEVTKPPLLPLMTQVLMDSGRISSAYLQRLEEGQCRIADTLVFLAAWRVLDAANLWRRMQASTAQERIFVESRLCRFTTEIFDRIGADLRRSLSETSFQSPFLSLRSSDEAVTPRPKPAVVRTVAGAPV